MRHWNVVKSVDLAEMFRKILWSGRSRSLWNGSLPQGKYCLYAVYRWW